MYMLNASCQNEPPSLRRSISCPSLPSNADQSASGKQLVDNLECLNLRLPCRMLSRGHLTLTRVNEVFILLGWASFSLLSSTNTAYRILDSVFHWNLPSRRLGLTGQCTVAFS